MSEFNINNEGNNNPPSQEAILHELQYKHARQIIESPGLLDRVTDTIKARFTKWKIQGDVRPVVSHGYIDTLVSDGSWQRHEDLRIGIEQVGGDSGRATTILYATVAQRRDTPDGSMTQPLGVFTTEDAELIAACTDELAFAHLSGQLPNLSKDFSRIYIPQPETDNLP